MKGFVLIIVLVLGLQAYGLGQIKKHVPSKREVARIEVAQLTQAMDRLRLDMDRYPTDSEGLQALLKQPKGLKYWKGPYIDKVPLDPWKHPFHYRNFGNNNIYIASYGADGKKGGKGENADIANTDTTRR